MAPFKLIPPIPGKETSLDILQVVVVGASGDPLNGTYGYRRWLSLTIEHQNSAFPMSFFCPNHFDVRDIETIAVFLRAIVHLPPQQQVEQVNRMAEIDVCRRILCKPWQHWAVLSGNGDNRLEFVSGNWADTFPFVSQQTHPQYKSCEMMALAIQYLILRGVEPNVADRRAADLSDFVTGINNMTLNPPPVTPPTRSRLYPDISSVLSAAPSPRRSTDTPSQSTANGSRAADSHASGTRHANSSLNAEQGTANTKTKSKDKGKGTSCRSAPDVHADEEHGEGSHRTDVDHRNNGSHIFDHPIYMHKRDVKGRIISSHYTAPATSTKHVPSLGLILDDYVDAYGYPAAFIYTIYTAWLAANNRKEFIVAVSSVATVAEAHFLWRWIEVPSDHSMRLRHG
ncbi:hypothetical protein BC835DRAFT_1418139 [Cytidiella melzeri]|nr:hypothetical protein BC835DRAFT_1418139 [Cytidiella melzeri]